MGGHQGNLWFMPRSMSSDVTFTWIQIRCLATWLFMPFPAWKHWAVATKSKAKSSLSVSAHGGRKGDALSVRMIGFKKLNWERSDRFSFWQLTIEKVRVSWCRTRPLISLKPFDALPSCDTGSYFAPGDLEPCPKKKKTQCRQLIYPSVISPSSQESH